MKRWQSTIFDFGRILLFAGCTLTTLFGQAMAQELSRNHFRFATPNINQETLTSELNRQAALTLTKVPRGMFLDGDDQEERLIEWAPIIPATLRYATKPGSRELDRYPNTLTARGTGKLRLNAAVEGMRTGVYYCILVADDDPTMTSVEFKVIVQANAVPLPNNPTEGATVSESTPLFSWDPVAGVPYYFLFLSEGPLRIELNDDGEITGLTGLNLTWQVVTPSTFMRYGDADPSGNFVNAHVPPLLPGIEYNWLVLNAYSAGPDFISGKVAPVRPSSFSANRAVSLQEPTLIRPEPNQSVADDEIVFEWTPVAGASRYRLFIYEEADFQGNVIDYTTWSQITTSPEIRLQASNFLVRADYHWRVVAESPDGSSHSERRPFQYQGPAGWAKFIIDSEEGPQSRVIVEIKNEIDGSILLPAVTDTFGVAKQAFPVGDYSFTARRPGFLASDLKAFTVPDNDTLFLNTTIERSSTTITGQVIDAAGSPIFDATLELFSGVHHEVEKSDAAGHFWFAVPAGNWSLRAYKLGFDRFGSVGISLAKDEGKDIGQIELTPATNTVTGVITFADDQRPFPGALVRAQSDDLSFQVTSNSQGGFRLELGPGTWNVTLDSQGFYTSPTEYNFDLDENQQISTPFELFSGGLVTGKVTFRGLGLKEGVIEVFTRESGALVQRGASNIQGNYAIGVQEGDYTLVASRPGFIKVSRDITISTGTTLVEDFELTEAGFVKGTVTNLESFEPVQGARILVIADSSIQAFSDVNGKYVLSLPPETPVAIDAILNGFGSNGPFTIRAASGDTVVQDIFLKALSGTIQGTVTDGFVPVNGAVVTVQKLNEEVVTGPDGGFQFEIPPGQYTVSASKACHFSRSEIVELAGGDDQRLDIVLPALRSVVAGRVTDPSDIPIEGAEVVAISDTVFSSFSDSGGQYNICLSSGIFRIKANKPGFVSGEVTVVVSDGDSLGGIDFQLGENFASVSGSVIDDSKAPVATAIVTLTNPNQKLITTTDGEGNFAIDRIVPGESTIVPSKEGFYGDPIRLILQGNQHVNIGLSLFPSDGYISGSVLDSADSTGIEGVLVSAQFSGDSERFFSDTTDTSGHYIITDLPVVPNTSYQVIAFKDGFASPPPVDGILAGATDVNFFLINRIGMISGRVVNLENDEPLQDARVEATNLSGGRGIDFTDGSGVFKVSGLIPNDRYTVTASKSGFFQASLSSIASGDTAVLLRLARKFGFVKGQVVDHQTGIGIEGIPMLAKPRNAFGQGRESQTQTGTNGEFMLTLIADDYIVQPIITHARTEPHAQDVTVAEVDTAVIEDFVLEAQTVQSIIVFRSDQSSDPAVSNTAEPCYSASARDRNDNVVTIGKPIWNLDVSQEAATIDSSGCVTFNPAFFGDNLSITATDPVSGAKGHLRTNVFAEIGPDTDTILFDDRGLTLRIPAGSVTASKRIQVEKQPIAVAKRGRAEFVTLDSSFVIKPAGLEFDQPVQLSLPPPQNSQGQRVFLAKWDNDLSRWHELANPVVNQNNRFGGDIDGSGEYVALAEAKSLGLENLTLLPNPFSPFSEMSGGNGLKIEFDLSSDAAPNPLLTIKVYNLEGNLVRLLNDQTPVGRGRSTVFWDGHADNGTMARNGRYLVRLVIEDPVKREEVLKSVVLIK
ncbi:carboxypeptidase regulatory-like domain-containing protein [bacterium]|nr:carboxypeptidase regulatory-like domain-containing protein [bacterium]